MYGFIPQDKIKWDYAVFLGNSPNINDDPFINQTGIDTTATVLVGGRIGIRYREAKLGLSATYDNTNGLQEFADELPYTAQDLKEMPRIRTGADFSFHLDRVSFETESIRVRFDDDLPDFDASLTFYYATLTYHLADDWSTYASYWYEEDTLTSEGNGRIKVPNLGMAYNINERITAKAQFARADLKSENPDGKVEKRDLNYYTLGISAIF